MASHPPATSDGENGPEFNPTMRAAATTPSATQENGAESPWELAAHYLKDRFDGRRR